MSSLENHCKSRLRLDQHWFSRVDNFQSYPHLHTIYEYYHTPVYFKSVWKSKKSCSGIFWFCVNIRKCNTNIKEILNDINYSKHFPFIYTRTWNKLISFSNRSFTVIKIINRSKLHPHTYTCPKFCLVVACNGLSVLILMHFFKSKGKHVDISMNSTCLCLLIISPESNKFRQFVFL